MIRCMLLLAVLLLLQLSVASAVTVIQVAPQGGQFSSIQAAIDSIQDAASGNQYLIQVAPGVYQELVRMKEYVSIHGAGQEETKITGYIAGFFEGGIVQGADHAELRFLTVESTGGDFFSIAIYNPRVSPEISNVTAIALNGVSGSGIFNIAATLHLKEVKVRVVGPDNLNYGIRNDNSSSGLMEFVDVVVSGEGQKCAIANANSSPEMLHVTAHASDNHPDYAPFRHSTGVCNIASSPRMRYIDARGSGGPENVGIHNGESFAVMRDVVASASGGIVNSGISNGFNSQTKLRDVQASASGGPGISLNYGIVNGDGSWPMLRQVTATATGGGPGSTNIGMLNTHANATARGSVFTGTGGSNNYGISNLGETDSFIVSLSAVTIEGSTNTVKNAPAFTTEVRRSNMFGGPVDEGGGTVVCARVVDENGTLYQNTCPP